MDADAIVVGAGLAGLAATAELARAGRRVLLLDQEPESNLGGQAFWSFGGLFLVGSPEQRRMGIRDSHALAWQDWMGSAFFDRGIDDPAGEDYWAYRWAQAYVDFAAGEKRSWLHGMGVRWLPLVGWAERGGYLADGHGNSVPRFHVTWGTGPAVVAPFERQVREAADSGLVGLRFRHRVDGLTVTRGTVDGVRGAILEPSQAARGTRSSRTELVAGMNKLTPEPLLELADLERQIVARDREMDNPFTKDLQVMAIRNARRSRGERLARTAAPHKILDPKAGPLIAVRLNILTRKTLGGLQTDLSGRVLGRDASHRPVRGLFAAGEVAGSGGGGMHGYRSLEGSFLGGCLFSGRQAGRAVARETSALPVSRTGAAAARRWCRHPSSSPPPCHRPGRRSAPPR
jgi:predicted oxidoreductase